MLYNKDWDKHTQSPADTLRKAADLIEQKGHTKHRLVNAAGAMCANGAIWFAVGGYASQFHAAQDALAKEISVQRRHDHNMWDIPGWNNAPERTAEEVIAAMRAAADKYEAALQPV